MHPLRRLAARCVPHRAAALLSMIAYLPVGAPDGSGGSRPAQGVERHTLRGDNVAVYNLAGVVRVEGGTGADVTVEVTPRGRDASRLRVQTGQARGREALRVLYPDDRIIYRDSRNSRWGSRSRHRVTVFEDGTFGDGSSWGDTGRGDRDGRRVDIVSEGTGLEAQADLTVRVPRGKRLLVRLAVGEASVTNVDGDLVVDVGAASVTTTGTRGRLLLDTGSGAVSVTDAQGTVELDTGAGDVTVTGVRGEELLLDTGSGSVRGRDITVTRLDLDSGSGSIRLARVRSKDISLDTGSGSVEVELLEDVDDLRIDSGSGDITITVPQSLGAEVTAETGSGGIDIDFPFELRRRSRGYLAGRIGDGRGRITIDSGSGSVTLRRG